MHEKVFREKLFTTHVVVIKHFRAVRMSRVNHRFVKFILNTMDTRKWKCCPQFQRTETGVPVLVNGRPD